jgi:hypothetical protein
VTDEDARPWRKRHDNEDSLFRLLLLLLLLQQLLLMPPLSC